MTRVLLDISRLISRVRHARPSGVDRVEMAYARGLRECYGDDLAFCAVHPSGLYGRINRRIAVTYLDQLEERWAKQEGLQGQKSVASVLPWMMRLLPRQEGIGNADVLVQVSPHHLTDTAKVRSIIEREQAKFVCLVHDLIPIEYPEYARPGGHAQHEARMESVAELADIVIVNSATTGQSLERWIVAKGKTPPPIRVAHLGTQNLPDIASEPKADDQPYFLCLGTIEPRKNHLLLLHLWREMAGSLPSGEVPRLVVIGRRGWENEQIVDLLDRCPALASCVEEINSCGDEELAAMIRGARGLLMPSFAEGYGMPIAEALSLGTPVIASELPAHREAGASAPEYLDPLDGPAWRAAILDFAEKGPLWQAQQKRIAGWKAPTWSDHIATASELIDAIGS